MEVTVNNPTVAPTSLNTNDTAICKGGSTILTQTGGSLGTGASWQWYSDASFNNLVGTSTDADASLSVNPTSTTTYYLRAESTTGAPCTANIPATGSVEVTVNDPSVAPTALNASLPVICNGSNTTVILSQSDGVLGTDAVWKWYTDANFNTPVTGTVAADGSVTVTPTATTTYYLRTENNAGPCEANINGPASGITVTVNEPVTITKNLEQTQVEVCAGFPVSFSIEASGTGLSYQWTRTRNEETVSVGTNSPNLEIAQTQASDAGKYTVIVTGAAPCSEVTSEKEVELIVNQSIEITQQPQSTLEVCEGEGVTITINIAANGDIYDYVWRKNETPVTYGSKYIVSESGNLTITDLTQDDSGSYDVVMSSPGRILFTNYFQSVSINSNSNSNHQCIFTMLPQLVAREQEQSQQLPQPITQQVSPTVWMQRV